MRWKKAEKAKRRRNQSHERESVHVIATLGGLQVIKLAQSNATSVDESSLLPPAFPLIRKAVPVSPYHHLFEINHLEQCDSGNSDHDE